MSNVAHEAFLPLVGGASRHIGICANSIVVAFPAAIAGGDR